MMFGDFLNQYGAMMGGVAIATSTMLAVFLKRYHFKSTENNNARHHGSSFSSAIAAELIDNADRLTAFYLQIDKVASKKAVLVNYQELDTLAYEVMLDRIGRLGPALSFMVVDVYGDIRALKVKYANITAEDILKDREGYLAEIQDVLIKAIACAAIMYFYADYMSGSKWSKTIAPHRLIWLEREMQKFLEYVGKVDEDLDIVSEEEAEGIVFLKRIGDPEKRALVKTLFKTVRVVLHNLYKYPMWKAHLALRGVFYLIKNDLLHLLDITPNSYDVRSEKEYCGFLPADHHSFLSHRLRKK